MAKTGPSYWANLLHFYQPYGQKRSIIQAIAGQCYRPVAEGILANPRARVAINFTGVLLDQLAAYGHQDIIDMYAEAARRGQVEFVGSSKYHAILPLLPRSEALRQITINDETNRRYFGDVYHPKGFFLPEQAWDPALGSVLLEAGFEWVLLDELAYNGRVGQVDYSKTYTIGTSALKALFREHRLSATLMSAAPRDIESLKTAARADLDVHRSIITAMDGETFGHHRIGHEQLLFSMFRDPDITLVRMSEIFDLFHQSESVPTVACTWASSEHDIAQGIQFISWDDPENDIHKLQWKLLRLAVKEMNRLAPSDPHYDGLRSELDPAVSSDQFFWAAARPWGMIEHIERGAYELLNVLRHVPNVTPAAAAEGLDIYHEILSMAYDWQRTGKIDSGLEKREKNIRIPFQESTLEEGDKATWEAIIDLLKNEERLAAGQSDYEAAILWRNAVYKLEHKLDVYDTEYVVDILRKKLPEGKIEETLARYKAKYDYIRGGQVEQRSN
jgi:hypothetical protein